MRKVISFMHVSLDGFTTGPNGELEWAIVDEELNPYVDDLFRNVDTALYGRVTYQLMQSYWPTVLTDPEASPRDLAHAHWVENVSKIVFSTTLSSCGMEEFTAGERPDCGRNRSTQTTAWPRPHDLRESQIDPYVYASGLD